MKLNRIFNMKYVMFLLLIGLVIAGCSSNQKEEKKEKVLYTCPMHPQIIQDHPGVCPICHMDLVIKPSASKDTLSSVEPIIEIGNNEAKLANLKTIVVKKEELKREIKAFSTIDFSEESKRTISARFNGRIEKLFVNKTGSYIKKGDPLFEIYSPEIIQAQNDLLLSAGNEKLSAAAEDKLLLLGITGNQIASIKNNKKVENRLTFYSPYSGTVLEKKIQEGIYISEGTILYNIADFSTVWNIADVYETDLASIKTGDNVNFTVQAYPGESFSGKVNLIYPVIDPQNRTVKVRSVISNSSGKLKPNMFGETIFQSPARSGLLIPAEAILMTGQRNIVYIKAGKGKFIARDITLGAKLGDRYEVLSGLNENEEIAYSGAYLMDSESQLRGISK